MPTQQDFWLDKEEGLLPYPNCSCLEHEEESICFRSRLRILPRLHVFLQPGKARSTPLRGTFSEQVYEVASIADSGGKHFAPQYSCGMSIDFTSR